MMIRVFKGEKNMRKIFKVTIVVAILFSMVSISYAALSDIDNHWANKEISYMVEKEILKGYPDGSFKPTNNITKAEFYKVINGLIGYSLKTDINFKDVKEERWFFEEVEKGVAAKYIIEEENLFPETKITREEVARILSVVFDVEVDNESGKKFTDFAEIPENLRGIFGGLVRDGYLAGYPDGSVKPKGEIQRSEVVKLLSNISGEIINKKGIYSKDIEKNMLVNAKDVTLKDMTIKGNLYLTEGIGDGEVVLDNIKIEGSLSVKGGGVNSIIIKNSELSKIIIGKDEKIERLVLENTTVNGKIVDSFYGEDKSEDVDIADDKSKDGKKKYEFIDTVEEMNSKESIEGASIDFGFIISDSYDIEIKEVEIDNPEDDVEIFAYDFTLHSGKVDGIMEITIDYEADDIDDEANSVCGKYYNEKKKKWKDVDYIVNTKNKTVTIFTDHLSIYGAFVINNPDKRSAYISDINIYAGLNMTSAQAGKVLEAYGSQAPSWEKTIFDSTIEAFGDAESFLSTAHTSITLGGAYDGIFTKGFNKSVTALGVSNACTQFLYDAYQYGLRSEKTAVSALESTLDVALNFATPSIQLAYVGVAAIKVSLDEVKTFAIDNKYQSTLNMYKAYYNRPENKLKAADWLKTFEKIYKNNKNEPKKVIELIEKEIDSYANKYWKVAGTDWESWIDAYDINGSLSKYPWPTKKDQDRISANHKKELMEYLTAVFNVFNKNIYYDNLDDIKKEYNKVKQYYNQKFSIEITENIPKGEKATWDNYYFKLGPISSGVDSSSWTGRLDDKGRGIMSFTMLGHEKAGYPMELKLFEKKNDMNKGSASKTIKLKPFGESTQRISIEPIAVEEEEVEVEEEEEEEEKIDEKPVINRDYQLHISDSDNSGGFAGWYAIIDYPSNKDLNLSNMFKIFDSRGKCIIDFSDGDYIYLEEPNSVLLYEDEMDLLKGNTPDLRASFSIGSAKHIGGNDYKIEVKAKPPEKEVELLEGITGIYESYIIYENFWVYGLPEAQIKNYDPWERPSADVRLIYTYNYVDFKSLSEANPNQYSADYSLEKINDFFYRTISGNMTYELEIISIGERAKLTFYEDSPSTKSTTIYILERK